MATARGGGAPAGDGGFTLLEAVVALGIVAIVITSYLGIRTGALADGIEARNWRLAREIAEEHMSEIAAGAHELPPQSGVEIPLEQYPGFSFVVAIGESAVSELESSLTNAAAESAEDNDGRDRQEWQRNRDLYRKASARGMTALEYESQVQAEEYQRKLEAKAPSESEFEEVAVAVYFPKLDAKYQGQKESYVIKGKLSTLALSGMTPDQAHQVAEAQGLTDGGGGSGGSPGGASAGGGNTGGGNTGGGNSGGGKGK